MTEDTGKHCCKRMAGMIDDPRFPVEYGARFREYSIRRLKNGKRDIVVQGMSFCPWCGRTLP